MRELGQPAAPEQIRTGVACVAQVGRSAPHQCAHRRGAHPGQRLLMRGLMEHIAVGADQSLFEECLLLSGPALGVLLLKHRLDDIAGPLRGLAASLCAAHAVTDQRPRGTAGQLPGAVIILIFLTDAANIRFSC